MSRILISLCVVVLSLNFAHGNPLSSSARRACTKSGHYFLPHESDCAKYYVCNELALTLQHCAGDLLWDVDHVTCNFPWAVQCEAHSLTDLPTEAPPKPTTGKPIVTEAPRPTTAQPTTDRPITARPTTAQPAPSTARPSTTAPPSPPGDLTCPAVDFIYVAHPSNCSQFYRCLDGTYANTYNCGADLWFSTKLQACVRKEKSDCQA